jgi:hypothetical protein
MWIILTQMAEANGAGAGAVAPIMEFFVSIIATIIGGVVLLAILFKGATLLFSHDRENLGGWVVGFLFGVALIAGARPIAAGVTGFAAGISFEMLQVVTVSEIVGYLLGDLLWGSIVLGGSHILGQWIRQGSLGERHGH